MGKRRLRTLDLLLLALVLALAAGAVVVIRTRPGRATRGNAVCVAELMQSRPKVTLQDVVALLGEPSGAPVAQPDPDGPPGTEVTWVGNVFRFTVFFDPRGRAVAIEMAPVSAKYPIMLDWVLDLLGL